MKILKKKYKQWKLRRLEKKIQKLFDKLGCDELFYSRAMNELYAVWWRYSPFISFREIPEEKEKRIKLIEEYRRLLEDE